MKKTIAILSIALLFSASAFADSNCFLITENNKIISQEGGGCKTRHSPCSTFKIPIAAMGYDDGFLNDEITPKLTMSDEDRDWLIKEKYSGNLMKIWEEPQTPTSWIKNSCVWYSQTITRKLGEKKFSSYIKKFNYGNQDVSGDIGKNNGLTESWLGSSLKISPQEQIEFLKKLSNNKLPINTKASELVKNILFVEELSNGWKLYGKTGSCDSENNNQNGWFVGFAEKDKQKIIFANYIEEDSKSNYYGGKKAKEQVRKKLISLIEAQNL